MGGNFIWLNFDKLIGYLIVFVFINLFEILGKWMIDSGNDIDWSDFVEGIVLYVFDVEL